MSDNAREGTNVEVFDTEIVEKLNPIQVTGVMQFVIPTPDKAMYMIHKSLVGMQKTIESSYAETTRLLNILNISMYEYENRKSVISDTDVTELLSELSLKMDAIAGVFASLPEWIPAHTLQESTGLSVDAIRKQLQNPKNFEPEVDYKQIGKIWHINRNAIPKVRRQK